MSNETSNVEEKYPGLKDASWFGQFRYGSNPWMARYVYGLIFLLTNLLAWGLRDYGQSALTQMQRLNGCHGGQDCLGTEGVLRVSMGCFLFFFTMFISTIGTSKLDEYTDSWHSGYWSSKAFLFLIFLIFPFLLPTTIIDLYGEIAHFGAGVFLLIQLVSVISFITWLNDCCLSAKYSERCHIYVMLFASTTYILCLAGITMLYIWYAPEMSCFLNIFFISWTLVLLQLMTSISLHPKINAGLLAPGLMGLYVVFICWSAIRSEPPGTSCNKKAEGSSKSEWLTVISFIIALLAIVVATFSTGIDSQCFQVEKKDEDDVPYSYGFFHFVFSTGAMYFAMLLIGWNVNLPMKKWTIDVGWTSTWVKIVNEWIAAFVYIWILLAPVIQRKRQAGEFP